MTLEPPLRLGDLEALHQQVQHQHPGDFIGVHPCLQMHRRPAAVAFVTPGTDPHGLTIVVANIERNILHHWLVLRHVS
ncbi:hypothetical protein D3C76_1657320 [compost metagenome]